MRSVTPLLAAVLLIVGTGAGYSQSTNNQTPTDVNQGVERDVHGAPHGSITNPGPHGRAENPRTTESGAPISTPTDVNQGAERDVHGAPHGSMNNPSPHGR